MKSRVEALILNILGEQEELSPPLSRIEEILYSILNDTAYIKDPLSRIEAIVLAIKEKDEYTRKALSRIEEILTAVLDGTNDYDKLPQSDIERDLIRFLGEWVTKTGDIVTFSTDQVVPPFKRCEVELEPIQDLHGYDNPWPAGGGKNKWNPTGYRKVGSVFSLDGDTYTMSWTNGSLGATTENVQTFESGSWSISATGTNVVNVTFYIYNADTHETISVVRDGSGSFTASAPFFVGIGGYYNAPGTAEFKVQLEAGSTATSYAPYSNICPISGRSEAKVTRTGKNLLPNDFNAYHYDGNYLVYDDFVPAETPAFMSFKDKDTSVSISGMYLGFCYGVSGGSAPQAYKWVISNGNIEASHTNTANQGITGKICTQIFIFPRTKATFDALFARYDIQVELGSTASSYQPYQVQSITVPLGQTVYGGTLDVTEGKLTIDRAMVTLNGSETWVKSGGQGYYTQRDDIKRLNDYTGAILCDKLPTFNRYSTTEYMSAINGITAYYSSTAYLGQNWFYAKANGAETANDFKAWLADNPLTVVYELATPVEVTLTPEEIHALLGNNCVWSDAGKITVTYHS